MVTNSKRIQDLPLASNVISTDRVVVLYNAISNGALAPESVRTITFSNFVNSVPLKISNNVPINATSYGIPGTAAYDSVYFYQCIASNTWIRIAYDSTVW